MAVEGNVFCSTMVKMVSVHNWRFYEQSLADHVAR